MEDWTPADARRVVRWADYAVSGVLWRGLWWQASPRSTALVPPWQHCPSTYPSTPTRRAVYWADRPVDGAPVATVEWDDLPAPEHHHQGAWVLVLP